MRWTLSASPLLLLGCGLYDGGLSPIMSDAGVDVVAQDGSNDVVTIDGDTGVADVVVDTGFDAPPLAPDQIPGLAFWLRADRGVDLDAGLDGAPDPVVSNWHDQSDAGDVNRNAGQIIAALQPTLKQQDAEFANNPTIQFVGQQKLATGVWNAAVSAPTTVFLVGKSTALPGTYGYFLDSLTPTPRMAVLCSPQSQNRVQLVGAGIMETLVTGRCDSAASIVSIFDSAMSSTCVNSKQLVGVSGVGSSGWSGATIGNNFQSGIGYAPRGPIAEIALWPRRLTALELEGLQKYSGARYGITIQ